MRLINVHTRQLVEFVGADIPAYAILSHTWEEGEVSYQEFINHLDPLKRGWQKIWKTCELTKEHGLDFVWVDTCNIDKTSSAELSEAINSMYAWYEQSRICFVWLSDWSENDQNATNLRHCRWFTRGWTLQELIAPQEIVFFDSAWQKRGTKDELVEELYEATLVDKDLLLGQKELSDFSVAQKMSWAANRDTTRKEDVAYSLLGIFDLNMPLLYGEGNKAFRRLQEEIIRTTTDLSIFAWKTPRSQAERVSPLDLCGILAASPSHFKESNEYTSWVDGLRDFSSSNIGIRIRTRLYLRYESRVGNYSYVLPVAYRRGLYLGVRVRQIRQEQYLRQDPYSLLVYVDDMWQSSLPAVERFLLTKLPIITPKWQRSWLAPAEVVLPLSRAFVLQFKTTSNTDLQEPWPLHRFDHEDKAFIGSSNSKRDIGIVSLVASPSVYGMRPAIIVCQFFALGWYNKALYNAQFGLVEDGRHSAELAATQRWVEEWDPGTRELMEELNRNKIPKQSGVVVRLERGHVALITFQTVECTDKSICTHIFWKVEFTCKVVRAEDCPTFPKERWDTSIPKNLLPEEGQQASSVGI